MVVKWLGSLVTLPYDDLTQICATVARHAAYINFQDQPQEPFQQQLQQLTQTSS